MSSQSSPAEWGVCDDVMDQIGKAVIEERKKQLILDTMDYWTFITADHPTTPGWTREDGYGQRNLHAIHDDGELCILDELHMRMIGRDGLEGTTTLTEWNWVHGVGEEVCYLLPWDQEQWEHREDPPDHIVTHGFDPINGEEYSGEWRH